MAVKTREEILSLVNDRIGEDSSDEAIGFMEDISDTFDDLQRQVSEAGNWRQKYEDNDREWREKYRERFMSDGPVPPAPRIDPPKPEPKYKSFDDLFTTE